MKRFLISACLLLSCFSDAPSAYPETNLAAFGPVVNTHNVCNHTENYGAVPHHVVPSFRSVKANLSNPSCDLCKDIVAIIKQELLVSNRSIVDIERFVCLICKHLPEHDRKECYSIINALDMVKQLILDGLNPGEICDKIKLCTKI